MLKHALALLAALGVLFVVFRAADAPLPNPPIPESASRLPAAVSTPQDRTATGTRDAPDARYRVVRVIDGDTFSIRLPHGIDTVRLIGIDTPETVHPSKPVECFGAEASSFARELLSGERVRLEFDESQGTRDKYGRLLAYAYLPDGTFVNYELIARGYAYEYTYELPYRYRETFREAERAARAQTRGLWAPGACTREHDEPSRPNPAESAESAAALDESDLARYTCSRNTYDCADFRSRAEAQAIFLHCGGKRNDVHWLDGDKDGLACERLP